MIQDSQEMIQLITFDLEGDFIFNSSESSSLKPEKTCGIQVHQWPQSLRKKAQEYANNWPAY